MYVFLSTHVAWFSQPRTPILRILWFLVVVSWLEIVMATCEICLWKGKSLEHHLRASPECCPPVAAAGLPSVAHVRKQSTCAARCKELAFCHALREHVAEMHLEKIMHKTHVNHAIDMTHDAVSLLRESVLDLVKGAPAVLAGVDALISKALATIDSLKYIDKTCEAQLGRPPIAPVPRPLLGSTKKFRSKHFAFYSVLDLCTDVLQHDATARQHIVTKSDYWGTGELYQKEPTMLTDMEDARRFRWSPAAKAFPPGGRKRRIRIVIDAWNDDMTVRVSLCRPSPHPCHHDPHLVTYCPPSPV